MAEINTQSFKFTSSGLLTAATGPNNVAFPKVQTTLGGITDQPVEAKKIRIQGIAVVKTGASGSVEIYDATAADSNPIDVVYETDVTGSVTNLGINIKSGDVFVKITGGYTVFLYLDLNS